MPRKFLLQPLWGTDLPPIELPGQPTSKDDNFTVSIGSHFVSTFPLLNGKSLLHDASQIAVSIRYILPPDSLDPSPSSVVVDGAYKLEITNRGAATLFLSQSTDLNAGNWFGLYPDVSAVVEVGNIIGWANHDCTTKLILSTESPSPTTSMDTKNPISVSENSTSNNGATSKSISVDTKVSHTPHSVPSNTTAQPPLGSGMSTRSATESKTAVSSAPRNPLKAPHVITAPAEPLFNTTTPTSPTRVKQEHGNGAKVNTSPDKFRDLPSPRTTTASMLTTNPTIISPHTAPVNSMQAVFAPMAFAPTPLDTISPGNPLIQQVQSKHAAELEALLMKQQLELITLATNQKLEFDAILRGTPLIPSTNGVNIGLLQVYNVLSRLQAQLLHSGGRSGLSHSDEVDIMSVDEYNAPSHTTMHWKAYPASAHATPQPAATTSSRKRNSKRKDASTASTATTSAAGSQYPANHRTSASNAAAYGTTAVLGAASGSPAESGSEDDSGARRTARKRVRPVQTDYFVDDREMEQILGGRKRRAELPNHTPHSGAQGSNYGTQHHDMSLGQPFQVPVAVPVATSVNPTPVTYKKPKPRDNVAIATILDIYAPNKSTQVWKHTTGTKTLLLYHSECLDHITPEWHLESPNRLKAVMESIQLVSDRYPQHCIVLADFAPAELDLVRTCHQESYIRKIRNKIPQNRAIPPLHATQDIDLSLSMSLTLPSSTSAGSLSSSTTGASSTSPAPHASSTGNGSSDRSSSVSSNSPSTPAPTLVADPACEPPKDTYVSFGSWNAALLAAGAVVRAIDALFGPSPPAATTTASTENVTATQVEDNSIRNVFCGVRPPGHHAGSHGHDGASTNGYCVLNSVAIGAQHAFNKYQLKRIAILDFDVHQGNGTAQIVEKDPRILFISLHSSDIYPFTESSRADADKCTDRVINIGYPTGTNGKQFMELFLTRCRQLIVDFNPELILLSSGFDAHVDDPTGAAQLRFADYVALTRVVQEIADTPVCQGRIISVLEGGNDIRALKLSVAAHMLALMGGQSAPKPPPPAAVTAPSASESSGTQTMQVDVPPEPAVTSTT